METPERLKIEAEAVRDVGIALKRYLRASQTLSPVAAVDTFVSTWINSLLAASARFETPAEAATTPTSQVREGGGFLRPGSPVSYVLVDTARVRDVLCGLVGDHGMWIDDDGQPLDYRPEREALIAAFVDDVTDALGGVREHQYRLQVRTQGEGRTWEAASSTFDFYEQVEHLLARMESAHPENAYRVERVAVDG